VVCARRGFGFPCVKLLVGLAIEIIFGPTVGVEAGYLQ
jgi:hypothetical protein